jgi:ufm1-conjugating enzyme 1
VVLIIAIVVGYLFLNKDDKKAVTSSSSADSSDDIAVPDTEKMLPYMRTRAGPRDPDWSKRLKEELTVLMKYCKDKKDAEEEWFEVNPVKTDNKSMTKWAGKCWYYHESLKYEFELTFEIPVGYPSTNMDLCLPELMGTTEKMYRGGAICLTILFQPLWQKMSPKFGIAHALAFGLGPWMASEIPDLVKKGIIKHNGKGPVTVVRNDIAKVGGN